MTVREYIGARYVPLFMGEWNSANEYEPLSIVIHEGNSYTSRQAVPIGIAITNETYWVITGNYNAQVEAYRNEVQQFDGRLDVIEANGWVTTNRIDDGAVTTDKIANNSIDSSKIENGSIETDDIADGAITAEKLANDSIESIQKDSTLYLDYLGTIAAESEIGTYRTVQAGCLIDENILVIALNRSGTYTETDPTVTLKKIDITTGIVQGSPVVRDLGHCNTMCYNPNTNKIYAAGQYYFSANLKVISVINPTTLDIERTFTLSSFAANNVAHIAYDPTNDIYMVSSNNSAPREIGYDSRVNEQYFAVYDSDFNMIRSTTITGNIGHNASFLAFIDGKFYQGYNQPNYMFEISPEDFSIGKSFHFYPIVQGTRMASEIEFATQYNNICVCGFNMASGFAMNSAGIAKFSLNNNLTYSSTGVILSVQQTHYAEIYVNPYYDAYTRNGSSSKPFKTLFEALNVLTNPYIERAYIKFTGSSELGNNPATIIINYPVACRYFNKEIYFSADSNIVLKGLYVSQCSNVHVHNITLTDSFNIDNNVLGLEMHNNYNVDIEQSTVNYFAEAVDNETPFSPYITNGSVVYVRSIDTTALKLIANQWYVINSTVEFQTRTNVNLFQTATSTNLMVTDSDKFNTVARSSLHGLIQLGNIDTPVSIGTGMIVELMQAGQAYMNLTLQSALNDISVAVNVPVSNVVGQYSFKRKYANGVLDVLITHSLSEYVNGKAKLLFNVYAYLDDVAITDMKITNMSVELL